MGGRLVGIQGSMVGQSVMLGPETSLGREAGNTLVLADQTVGRRHAVVRQSGSTFTLEDLGSTNGTFVNDQRISNPTPLRSGDTIRLGAQVLVFEEAQVASPPKIEVGRTETAATATRPVENPGLFRSSSNSLGSGCIDINLEGCMRWLMIAILAFLVLTVLGLALLSFSGAFRGLGGLAGQPGQGGSSGGSLPGDDQQAPPTGEEGSQPNRKQGPVRIIDVRIDYGRRAGTPGVVPLVLVTWENAGDKPITSIRARITGYDKEHRVIGTIEDAPIYNGPPVGPGQQHHDTREQGGVVAVPGPANKLKQAPNTATVDVLDAH